MIKTQEYTVAFIITQRRALWGKVEEGGGGWPKSRRVTKTQAGDEWAGDEWAGGE